MKKWEEGDGGELLQAMSRGEAVHRAIFPGTRLVRRGPVGCYLGMKGVCHKEYIRVMQGSGIMRSFQGGPYSSLRYWVPQLDELRPL